MQVFVPLSLHLRGGRKTVISPAPWSCEQTPKQKFDNAMVKAIARAHRWRDMLENGTYATIREIAVAEKINESYVGRVLRLTLLAPDIVEAILGGRQPAGLQLDGLMRRFPVEWTEQRLRMSASSGLVTQCKLAYCLSTNIKMDLILQAKPVLAPIKALV